MPTLKKAKNRSGKEIENLLRAEETGIYYVKKTKTGKKILFKTTGTDNLTLAIEIRDNMIADWLNDKPLKRAVHGTDIIVEDSVTVEQLCDKFLEDRRISVNHDDPEFRISYKTFQKDKTETNFIKETFGTLPIASVTTKWWTNWYKVEAKKLSRGVRETKRYMSLIFKFAVQTGLLDNEPQFPLPPKRKEKAKGIFTDEEIGKLYGVSDPNVRLLVHLCIENGLRSFEAKRMRWDHIYFSSAQVAEASIENESPKKPSRRIRLSESSTNALRDHKAIQEKAGVNSPWVFPREDDPQLYKGDTFWSKHWNSSMEEVQLPAEKTSYWMRHTYITKAIHEEKKHTQDVSLNVGASETILKNHYAHGNIIHTQGMESVGSRIADLGRKAQKKNKESVK
jgi:integrase